MTTKQKPQDTLTAEEEAKAGTEVSKSAPSERRWFILKFRETARTSRKLKLAPNGQRDESLRGEVAEAEAWGRGQGYGAWGAGTAGVSRGEP